MGVAGGRVLEAIQGISLVRELGDLFFNELIVVGSISTGSLLTLVDLGAVWAPEAALSGC